MTSLIRIRFNYCCLFAVLNYVQDHYLSRKGCFIHFVLRSYSYQMLLTNEISQGVAIGCRYLIYVFLPCARIPSQYITRANRRSFPSCQGMRTGVRTRRLLFIVLPIRRCRISQMGIDSHSGHTPALFSADRLISYQTVDTTRGL